MKRDNCTTTIVVYTNFLFLSTPLEKHKQTDSELWQTNYSFHRRQITFLNQKIIYKDDINIISSLNSHVYWDTLYKLRITKCFEVKTCIRIILHFSYFIKSKLEKRSLKVVPALILHKFDLLLLVSLQCKLK